MAQDFSYLRMRNPRTGEVRKDLNWSECFRLEKLGWVFSHIECWKPLLKKAQRKGFKNFLGYVNSVRKTRESIWDEDSHLNSEV